MHNLSFRVVLVWRWILLFQSVQTIVVFIGYDYRGPIFIMILLKKMFGSMSALRWGTECNSLIKLRGRWFGTHWPSLGTHENVLWSKCDLGNLLRIFRHYSLQKLNIDRTWSSWWIGIFERKKNYRSKLAEPSLALPDTYSFISIERMHISCFHCLRAVFVKFYIAYSI